jgi:NAD(P)-dependent dehydrogenase (short-subunit alcohol dehydrogenase family)
MSFARYPSLIDKVVFITGGGSGIGAAMVEAFAEQKANVAFVDIAVEASKDLLAKIGASHPRCFFTATSPMLPRSKRQWRRSASAWARLPCSSTTPPTTTAKRRTK